MSDFDTNGKYIKTDWETGDRITKKKLNKIETAIETISRNEVNNTTDLKIKISNTSSELKNKADKNEVFTMANMGQDIREAMTGGSVAVVGDNTILSNNIVDRQVTYIKTDFMYFDNQLNMFNGNFEQISLTGYPTLKITADGNSKTAIVKVNPNTTYSILKDKASRFQLGTASRLLNVGEELDGNIIKALGNTEMKYVIITTGPNDAYLYINVTIDNEDIFLQVVKGYQTELSTNSYMARFNNTVNVYSKNEVDSIIDDVKITPDKTSFLKRNVADISKNKIVFKGYRIQDYGDNSTIRLSTNENSCVAMVDIQPDTTYSILLRGTDLVDEDGRSFVKILTSSVEYRPTDEPWNDGRTAYYHATDTLNFTFTSGENDKYLYIYYTDSDMHHDFVVCKGEYDSIYYEPVGINVFSKSEKITKTDVDFIFKDSSLNLWDGIKYENRRLSGAIPNIKISEDTNSDLYIAKVKPYTTYSIIAKDTDLLHNEAKYIKVASSSVLYDESYTGDITYTSYNQPSGSTSSYITTGENDIYLYMYLFTKESPSSVFQVVEGKHSEMSIETMEDVYVMKGVSVYPKHRLYTKDEVDALLASNSANDSGVLKKNGETFTITMGKAGYTFRHNMNTSINLDTWMLTSGSARGYVVWSGSDIEGPIKELGASDFIGGVHGDEICESINIVCDGNLLSLIGEYDTTFNNLTIFVKSTLYRCGTTVPVFTRYKKLEFKNSELVITNKLVCLVDNFLINRYTGCGLYSIYKDIMSGYTVNTAPELKTNGGMAGDEKMDVGVFYGDGYTVTLKTIEGKTNAYKGYVQDFAEETRPRYKLYFDCINSSDGYPVNKNDEILASFSIRVD